MIVRVTVISIASHGGFLGALLKFVGRHTWSLPTGGTFSVLVNFLSKTINQFVWFIDRGHTSGHVKGPSTGEKQCNQGNLSVRSFPIAR